jgi:uncharacterized damage-inducible protein DinB
VATHIGSSRAAQLEAEVQSLLRQAETLPADALYTPPAPGQWSAMQILAHVAELVPYWASQARAVAQRTQDDQPFGRTEDDPDRLEAIERHARDRLEDVLSLMSLGLDEACALLRAIPDEGWSRTAHHPTRGEMSVEEIVARFLLDHVVSHQRQLAEAVGRA